MGLTRQKGGSAGLSIVTGSQRRVLCHTPTGWLRLSKLHRKKYPHIHVTATIQNQDDEVESFHVTQTLLQNHPEINALYFAAGGVYMGGCKAVGLPCAGEIYHNHHHP